MKHEKVEAILDKKVSELHKLSDKVAVRFDADVIHDLRVAVKSLRAMMRMLAEANGERFKLPKKFKHLYHIAGDIREAQLELEKIKEMKLHLPQYEAQEREIIKRGKSEWEKLDLSNVISKLERRIRKVDYRSLRPTSIKHFIEGRLTGIYALCASPEITDDMVHSMRKQLKDVMYVVKQVRKEDEKVFEDVDVDLKQIDHNSQLLGNYNDERIMLEHLVAFSPMCSDPAERQAIMDIYGQNRSKLKVQRGQIVGNLLEMTNLHAISVYQTGTELPELNQGR